MLNTTICHEDDSLRSYVAKFIEQYFKRNHIQYKISCCPSLHNLTTRFHPIDLLFTDIIFSDKTEMSTLLKIRKQHPSMMMVILTNNNEYAIQGYKLGILRYIMKEQLEHELPHCMDAVLARYFKHRDVLEMKFVEGKYCVYQDEIVYMESQGHKVNMQQLYFGNLALDPNRQRRIVYYGRVSTEHEAQLEALEKQMQWYEDQTKYHPNWTVVGKYIDEGITGTLAKKRPSFMKMIEDAKQRKFDLIVTREVCRFARNTVDTLVLTRELKNYGVEVYFVSDNIWTMDGDGELRLTIMATLAQEESRKISERVRAGQAVSRENGVLFGNGNIIGYDRVGSTYVINPEQAATIRTIFELYSQGLGQMKIVNELTRRGCKDGNGNVKWSCIKISRILRNATYMGYLCYNKSKVNNFLEKRRIKNLDEDSFILKKGDFEPIISEALWHQCENIRNGRIRKYQMPSGEERRRGTRIAQNLWVKKLRCRCGAGYNRFKWRVLQDGTPVYGYQCNYRTQNPAKTFVEKNHLDSQKYCDAITICEWKLDLMAKMIFDQLWGDQREAVLKACQMIESCILSTTLQTDSEKAEKQKKIEKLEQRLLNLGQMRADGELTREQFQKLYAQTTTELDALKTQQNSAPDSAEEEVSFDLNKIKKGLSQMVDITAPRISEELIDEFVEAVTPVENHHYRWKMTFGEMKSGQERYNLMEPENSPVLSFTIDFETARQYRMSNGLPAQFRQRGWTDLNVEVYL